MFFNYTAKIRQKRDQGYPKRANRHSKKAKEKEQIQLILIFEKLSVKGEFDSFPFNVFKMKNLRLHVFILSVFAMSPGIGFAQSIELDKMLGEENARMVVAQMGIYNDQGKTEYIREVGERLLLQLPDRQFEYQFNIVPEFTPNAFALPGGYIFITTGLLPIIESEDELACLFLNMKK